MRPAAATAEQPRGGGGDLLLGLPAGLGTAGLLHATSGLVSPAPGWLRESLTLAVGGNLLVALMLVALVGCAGALLRRPWRAGAGRAFALGLAVGLVPTVGSALVRLGWYRGHATVGFWALPLLLLLAARWPRAALPGRALCAVILAACLGVWSWAGGRGLEPAFVAAPPAPLTGDVEHRVAARDGDHGGESAAPVSTERPDVILVSFDTLRADAVHGAGRARVPNLDALGARGLRAPYARSGSNCTLPGHVEMFSGIGPLGHGILNNSGVTPDELPLLGRLFAEAGWRTRAVVSNRVIEARFGPSQGFEEWADDLGTAHSHLARLGEHVLLGWVSDRELFDALLPVLWFGGHGVQEEWGAREGERTVEAALAQLARLRSQPAPAFLFVHFMDAHDPYRAPAGWYRTRDPMPRRSVGSEPLLAAEDSAHAVGLDATESARLRARYWEEVDYLDHCLGRLIDALDAGQRPWVLLVTGDHGEHLGEHAMVGHSDELYEPVVRVPFVLAGAGVPIGQLPPVSLVDVAPTLLACAGLPVPEAMEGIDVRRGSGAATLDDERFLFGRDERSVSAVVGPWKWTADWPRDAEVPTGDGLFRDLRADPTETGPPAAEPPPGVLEHLRARLGRAVLRGAVLTPERRAALAQLGYLDDATDQ